MKLSRVYPCPDVDLVFAGKDNDVLTIAAADVETLTSGRQWSPEPGLSEPADGVWFATLEVARPSISGDQDDDVASEDVYAVGDNRWSEDELLARLSVVVVEAVVAAASQAPEQPARAKERQ